MVEEAYVSYKLAKLLKEKGFDSPCRLFYKDAQAGLYEFKNAPKAYKDKLFEPCFLAPTHQLAMAWIRENGWHIDVSLSYDDNDDACYYVVIQNTKTFISADTSLDDKEFKTYEEAVEAALKYSLENLI